MPRRDYLGARRGPAALWASRNPVLDDGEIGAETDTHRFKIGDGVTHWVDLSYVSATFDLENVPVQQLRDTDANLAALTDPFLSGQLVYGQTTGKTVVGDGESLYDELPDLRKQFKNVVTVSKDGAKGSADFICSDSRWNSDDECIQAAIDYMGIKIIKTLLILDGVYNLSNDLTCYHDINIYGIGEVTFVSDGLDTRQISITGSVVSTLDLLGDVTSGVITISVSDTSSISVGNLIKIYDNTPWGDTTGYQNPTGELHEIVGISGTDVTFSDGLLHNYTVTNGGKISIINPVTVKIHNINFNGTNPHTELGLLSINLSKNVTISNSNFKNGGREGIYLYDCYNVNIADCNISECLMDGFGYGIVVYNSSAHISIYNNNIASCRHCFSAGATTSPGQARDLHIFTNDFSLPSASQLSTSRQMVDTHPCVESIYISDNIFHGNPTGGYAIVSGAKLTFIDDNKIYFGNGITLRGTGQNVIVDIENNKFYSCGYGFADVEGCSISNLNIENNKFYEGLFYQIYLNYSQKIILISNTIDSTDNYNGIYINNANYGLVINNYIKNTYRSGLYLLSSSNILINSNYIQSCNTRNGIDKGAGVVLESCSELSIRNNTIIDTNDYHRYSISEDSASDTNIIENNTLVGATITPLYCSGTGTKIFNNEGYTTENTGTATITASQTSVTISHGLVSTPTRYSVTPSANVGNCWIDTITSTQMTIHCSTAPETDTSVSWSAQVV